MKTAFIYVEVPERISYFIEEGDFRHLNGVYINGTNDEEKQDQLNAVLFDKDWENKFSPVSIEEVQQAVKEGAFLVEVGFYL